MSKIISCTSLLGPFFHNIFNSNFPNSLSHHLVFHCTSQSASYNLSFLITNQFNVALRKNTCIHLSETYPVFFIYKQLSKMFSVFIYGRKGGFKLSPLLPFYKNPMIISLKFGIDRVADYNYCQILFKNVYVFSLGKKYRTSAI